MKYFWFVYDWNRLVDCVWGRLTKGQKEYVCWLFELTRCLFFSLDPDSDPLCMLLLIDFLMLRSREYQSLLQLYQDWEVHFSGRQECEYCLCTVDLWSVCFCIAGLQKSVPAAKLLVLRCTLPFLFEPAGGWRSWRKKQTQTHGWPDAAEHAHNVPWRLVFGELNPTLMRQHFGYPSVISSVFLTSAVTSLVLTDV